MHPSAIDMSWVHIGQTAGILLIGILMIVAWQRTLRRALSKIGHTNRIQAQHALVIQRLSSTLLWLILILLAIRPLGIEVSGLWTILASTLAVIGVGLLAVWTMVSNITASFFIWIWKPYELGEQIEILPDQFKGRAIDRSLMFTVLREDSGHTLIIPNNLFFQKIIRREPNTQRQSALEKWEQEQAKNRDTVSQHQSDNS